MSNTKALFEFDLKKEAPSDFGLAIRCEQLEYNEHAPDFEDWTEEDKEDYMMTEDGFDVKLEVFKVSKKTALDGEDDKTSWNTFVHEEVDEEHNHFFKLRFTDEEHRYGTYGPNGGGYNTTVYVSFEDKPTREEVLKLFLELWNGGYDYFSY